MSRPFSSAFSLSAVLLSFVTGAAGAVPAQAAEKVANLTLGTKATEMSYDKTKLSVKAGQKVKLTFTNKATKDSGLQHNWVLVNPGKLEEVGQAALGSGPDKGYIPDSPEILAHTKLLSSGEKDTIEFTAPAKAGEYPYLCTFPGHFTMMKGVLQVK